MARKLSWRIAPELRFLLDKSVDEAERIASALERDAARNEVAAPTDSDVPADADIMADQRGAGSAGMRRRTGRASMAVTPQTNADLGAIAEALRSARRFHHLRACEP